MASTASWSRQPRPHVPSAVVAVVLVWSLLASPDASSGGSAGAAPVAAAPVAVAVTDTPDAVSRLETGVTHTRYSLDPWGDPAAVAAGKQVLRETTVLQNQHLMGWGADNPWPDKNVADPARWNWGTLDSRVQTMRDSGARHKVITLCCAPTWMFDEGWNGRTDWTRIEWAPTVEHYPHYARLAAETARRYPDVEYFQVWNEMKGFYLSGLNRWDYEHYTELYNQVYDAVKAARPDAKLGGPYVVMDANGSRAGMSHPSAYTFPWGTLDQRPIDVVNYWLTNKRGADFIALDAGVSNKDGVYPADVWSHTRKFADVAAVLRQQAHPDARALPLWWAEWYSGSGGRIAQTEANVPVHTALMATGLIHTLRGGARAPLVWEPQSAGTAVGYPVALFSDTRAAGGGRPTPFAPVQRAFKDHFGPGTRTYRATVSDPAALEVLASATKVLLVNKTAGRLDVSVNGAPAVALGAYEVGLVDAPARVAPIPTPTATATATAPAGRPSVTGLGGLTTPLAGTVYLEARVDVPAGAAVRRVTFDFSAACAQDRQEWVAPYYYYGDASGVPYGWDTRTCPDGDYALTVAVEDAKGVADTKVFGLTIRNAAPPR
jgi:hypothetical protein